MLCVYQAVRDLIGYAAPSGLDPGRVSFKRPSTPPGTPRPGRLSPPSAN